MAEYQRIEYRIGQDGKVIEIVLDGSGVSCTAATTPMEQALGQVKSQELLPAYYDDEEALTSAEHQSKTNSLGF